MGKLTNLQYLTIADFSKPSNEERLFIIDMQLMQVVVKSLVAHGRNSGTKMAHQFSNQLSSFQSSLGFYVTGGIYKGKHGASLELNGVEKGISKIGFNAAGFAPAAKKIVIDIDKSQLTSHPISIDIRIQSDIKIFLEKAIKWLSQNTLVINNKWIEACKYWKNKYPMRNENWEKDITHVNMYNFIEKLSIKIDSNSIILTGNGYECPGVYQSFQVKNGQRDVIQRHTLVRVELDKLLLKPQ